VIAAGDGVSAGAGADALRAGGNAVDAALAALLASFSCEPVLTSLGAGGYMLVIEPGHEPVVLDFFVEAPGRGADPRARGDLVPVTVSFGEAVQVFNTGPASVGTYGVPAGIAHASARFGSLPLRELTTPAAALARDGVRLTAPQAYVIDICRGLVTSTPESAALFEPGGELLRAGGLMRQPELADALELLGAEGAAPFYTGEIGSAIIEWISQRGGMLTREDLATYRVIEREPVRALYRGLQVVTNPPPSAGGILIAQALTLLQRGGSPPSVAELVEVMETTQSMRTSEFLEGLDDPEFVAGFMRGDGLGSTTHVSVIDREGRACSLTTSNGASSGVIVPGTGVHLNNMLGEQDLNPLGFHRHPPGRRLPSMMAPTAVLRGDVPEVVLGSAGSNRIRSAIIQTIMRVVDDGLRVAEAVGASRLHFEEGVIYAEPGIEEADAGTCGHGFAAFRERNLFFGGVQAVQRDPDGRLWGAGDPRRGGAAIVVDGVES
jgi:gamma-glutamyltranspeptidase / glutathione hydrolase